MGERVLDSGGLETLVLVKAGDGTWKIRHSTRQAAPVDRRHRSRIRELCKTHRA